MDAIRLRACAKLNLTLDVVARREDGYHQLEMIMQSVDLCDLITVRLNRSGRVTVECGALSGDDNLAAKAARLYFDALAPDFGAEISIEKHIPVCGGTAGGSADAAGVLAALDKTLHLATGDELIAIAKRLGADVPFAMVGGTALVGGIGEQIRPLKALKGLTFVLASVGEKDSTGKMFARVDALQTKKHPDTAAVAAAIESGNVREAARGFGNSFDPLWENPTAEKVRGIMTAHGALGCSVTGSGPTLFGSFLNEDDAVRCCAELEKLTFACVCRPTERSIFFE